MIYFKSKLKLYNYILVLKAIKLEYNFKIHYIIMRTHNIMLTLTESRCIMLGTKLNHKKGVD